MTLCHSWTMSAAGLSAPGLRNIPLRNAFAHGVASTRAYWDHPQDLNSLCLGLDAAAVDGNLKPQHQASVCEALDRPFSVAHLPQSPSTQRLPPKKFRPSLLILPSSMEVSLPSPPEGDQVVPSFQRLSVYEHAPQHTSGRGAKPLPPLPGHVDSSDDAVDNEVEFFSSTDESQRLVPESSSKTVAFGYGAPGRRSFRGCGQINYAYFEDACGGGIDGQQLPQPPTPTKLQCSGRDGLRQQDRTQRRLRRSHSGPAGSLNKVAALRLSCAKPSARSQDKPEVPPRLPIPPRPSKVTECRRWSAEVPLGACSDDEKPPRVPPREPVCHGSPQACSPKSLPTYTNGVMPPTQSFAPNPKYVSRSLQRQGSSEMPTSHTPCILPIMENGRKVSTTHYFLLPKRPVYMDRDKFERFFKERDGENDGASDPDWDSETRQKVPVDMV